MNTLSLTDFVAGLRHKLNTFGTLPESLKEGAWIPGTAFFPGGDGYIKPRSSDTLPDVMIVGRDFGTIDYLDACIKAGSESETQATWRGTLKRLEASGVERERCFFTNAFLGYRSTGLNTDDLPIHRDADFTARCVEFLRFQIDTLKPRAIVTLGKAVPSIVGGLAVDLNAWRSARTFKTIDAAGALFLNATFNVNHQANVCALVHPSKAWLNVKRRTFLNPSGFSVHGEEAEIAILREATHL